MAQVSVRARSDQQFLSDVNLITISDTKLSSGTLALRTIADGLTFVCVSFSVSIQPPSVDRRNAGISLNFPAGTEVIRWATPVAIDTSGVGTQWNNPILLNVKGLEFEGDGVDVLELEVFDANFARFRIVLTGYERNT